MSNEQFSPKESLQLIQSMIDKTKQSFSHQSFYFLLFGWFGFGCLVGQFILKHIINYPKHYLIWLLFLITFIIMIFRINKEKKNTSTKTYVGESMNNLWEGMGISFLMLTILFSRTGWGFSVYPFFILMYGLGTYVSGKILKFTPLVNGGRIAWVLAIVSVYFEYDYQMLFAAAALLFSYIIPAYILRIKKNN